MDQGPWRESVPGGRQRRTVRLSRRNVLRREPSVVEQRLPARGTACAGFVAAAPGLDRLSYRARATGTRREDLLGSRRSGRYWTRQDVVGQRGDVVFRWVLDLRACVRRDFRRRVHGMPSHRNDRNGAGIRDLSARAYPADAPRDTFYIDADDWKAMVYEQARDACLQAIAQLATEQASD